MIASDKEQLKLFMAAHFHEFLATLAKRSRVGVLKPQALCVADKEINVVVNMYHVSLDTFFRNALHKT